MSSDAADDALPTGYYTFFWRGGAFDVQLRTGGEFWCPQFPAQAMWSFSTSTATLEIAWGKYGEFVLRKQGDELVGGVRGDEEAQWRKMCFKSPFTPEELLLSGSAWMMHVGDEEPRRVEFRADGRCRCPSFPCAFSYQLKDGVVVLAGAMYGRCELTLDVSDKVMTARRSGGTSDAEATCGPCAADKFEYLGPLAAFVPPETCAKGCCRLEDVTAGLAQCKIGRKRGQSRQDEYYEASATSVTVRPGKFTSGGLTAGEAPLACKRC